MAACVTGCGRPATVRIAVAGRMAESFPEFNQPGAVSCLDCALRAELP